MKIKQLILSTVALAVATSFVSNSALAVTADNVVCNQCVHTSDIANGAVNSQQLRAGAVNTVKIQDNAVTTAKIASGAVTSGKIASNSINSSKIANGEVKTLDINNGAVTAVKLRAASVVTAKIADGAVTSAKIANSTITNADIASLTIISSDIANGQIGGTKLAIGYVSLSHQGFAEEGQSSTQNTFCQYNKSNGTFYGYFLPISGSTIGSCDLNANIAIPHGTTVKWLQCRFYDNSTGNSISANLVRRSVSTGAGQVLFTTPGTVDSTSIQTLFDTTVSSPGFDLVNNASYTYSIEVNYSASDFQTLGSLGRLYSCQVRYN